MIQKLSLRSRSGTKEVGTMDLAHQELSNIQSSTLICVATLMTMCNRTSSAARNKASPPNSPS
jgi:hypothetical protein